MLFIDCYKITKQNKTMETKEKISFYLPYDVMFYDAPTGVLLRLNDFTIKRFTEGSKLILHPIEQCSSVPCHFDGDSSVVSDLWHGFTPFTYYYKEFEKYGPAYWHNQAPFCVTKWLLENHIDCFQMINDGLAVPYNSADIEQRKLKP